MNHEEVRTKFKSNPRLKRMVDWLIMNQVETRPRWFIVRMDTPPYRKFWLGDYSVVESFACINNAVGDVIIGDHTRIGLHNTIIGPVTIGSHVNLAQGITITALNHNFDDSEKRIDQQGISTKEVVLEDDIWVGANAVILPGVTIGKHAVVAAGAIVTKDVPPHSLVAGVPAKVIRQI